MMNMLVRMKLSLLCLSRYAVKVNVMNYISSSGSTHQLSVDMFP